MSLHNLSQQMRAGLADRVLAATLAAGVALGLLPSCSTAPEGITSILGVPIDPSPPSPFEQDPEEAKYILDETKRRQIEGLQAKLVLTPRNAEGSEEPSVGFALPHAAAVKDRYSFKWHTNVGQITPSADGTAAKWTPPAAREGFLRAMVVLRVSLSYSHRALGPGANVRVLEGEPLVFRITLDGGNLEIVDWKNFEPSYLFD